MERKNVSRARFWHTLEFGRRMYARARSCSEYLAAPDPTCLIVEHAVFCGGCGIRGQYRRVGMYQRSQLDTQGGCGEPSVCHKHNGTIYVFILHSRCSVRWASRPLRPAYHGRGCVVFIKRYSVILRFVSSSVPVYLCARACVRLCRKSTLLEYPLPFQLSSTATWSRGILAVSA